MMIMISGGSADTEAKAETVRPWVRSPARMVTMVTPAGKWRSALRNSSDEIKELSSPESGALASADRILPQPSGLTIDTAIGTCLAQFIVRFVGAVRTARGHSRRNRSMARIKSRVKGVLGQRVRIGLFTVPLWVVGAVFLARKLRERRRLA